MPYDLHTHSTASDGTTSPGEVVRAAAAAGLTGLALTDHDTGAGLVEAAEAARRPGSTWSPGSRSPPRCTAGRSTCSATATSPPPLRWPPSWPAPSDSRHGRLRRIVERLRAVVPELTVADVVARVPAGVTPGRPHIADALVAVGAVPDRDAAFDELLAEHGPYYVGYSAPGLLETVRLVVAAGGARRRRAPRAPAPRPTCWTRAFVAELADAGLVGPGGRPPRPRRGHPRAGCG